MSETRSIRTAGKPQAAASFELAASLRLTAMRLARRLRQRADAGITPSMLSALSSASGPWGRTARDRRPRGGWADLPVPPGAQLPPLFRRSDRVAHGDLDAV